jgi:DNA-binding response OmpR family regulator
MTEPKLILLVEDDRALNDLNREALEFAGYRVAAAYTLADARKRLAEATPDAIVLDVKLPDGSGVDFCREIRASITAPILFLTSLRTREDEMRGLENGGDDYLRKPFRIEVLLLRIEAFWRRDEIKNRLQPNVITEGALSLDLLAAQAFLNGRDIMLTQKEFALLLLFIKNKGQALGAEYLYEKIWGATANNDLGAIKVMVSKLRQKIEGSGYGILAVRGAGYRFEREQ